MIGQIACEGLYSNPVQTAAGPLIRARSPLLVGQAWKQRSSLDHVTPYTSRPGHTRSSHRRSSP